MLKEHVMLPGAYTWFEDEHEGTRKTRMRVRLRSFFVLHVTQLSRSTDREKNIT
ncbi:MAG: hypothetical protein QXD75_05710 [Desulfurococcaceae archaeon]